MAAAEVDPAPNPTSDHPNGSSAQDRKKSRESDRRRRRRKQKKNKAASNAADAETDEEAAPDSAKDNADPKPQVEVEVEYVPEKAELDDALLADFKDIFDKFTFKDSPADTEDGEKKDEAGTDAAKKGDESDSDDDAQEAQQKKDGGVSNKQKKLQRRMKIAELKQICARPDVVEVWDATASDPKLLVYLKSYRNTVPVPRHWCQKRKFLQG